MNDTKKRILEISRKLFAERGFNSVSIKDIADELGISKGNLTYHFQKKEHIMEELISETKGADLSPANTLEELNEMFVTHLNVMEDNAFYFSHYDQAGQISKKIKEMQKKANSFIKDIYVESFRKLVENKSLTEKDTHGRSLLDPEIMDMVIETLMLGATHWIPYQRMLGDSADRIDSERYLKFCWNVLNPWVDTTQPL